MTSLWVLTLALVGCKKATTTTPPLEREIPLRPGAFEGQLENGARWSAAESEGEPTWTLVVRGGTLDGPAESVASAVMPRGWSVDIGPNASAFSFDALPSTLVFDCCDDAADREFFQERYGAENLGLAYTGPRAKDRIRDIERVLETVPRRADSPAPLGHVTWQAATARGDAVRTASALPYPGGSRITDVRSRMLDDVGLAIVRSRFETLAADAEPRVLTEPLAVGQAAHVVELRGEAESAYRVVATEVERLSRWGILNSEIRDAERRVVERYTTAEPASHDEVHGSQARRFVHGTPIENRPAVASVAELHVPTFTVEELTAWAKEFQSGPRQVALPSDTAEEVRTTVDAEVAQAVIEPPLVRSELTQLTEPRHPAGRIEHKASFEALGFEKWTLSNGARVWVRDMPGEIVVRAVRKGGSNRFDPQKYRAALLAPRFRAAGGFDGLSPTQIVHFLAPRQVALHPSVSYDRSMLSGGASPADTALLLQLLHLNMVAPRFDADSFEAELLQVKRDEVVRSKDPIDLFDARWNDLVHPDDVRFQRVSSTELESLTPELLQEVWTGLFMDPEAFDFVIAGDLPDDFESLVQTWLASVPDAEGKLGRGEALKWGPSGESFEMRKGLEGLNHLRIEFSGPVSDASIATRERVEAVAEVLEELVEERLRANRGGVFGLRVEGAVRGKRYRIRLGISAHPELLDPAREAIDAAVEDFKTDALEEAYGLDLAERQSQLRGRVAARPGFWVEMLSDGLRHGDDLDTLMEFDARAETRDTERLQADATMMLDDKRRTVGLLIPEEGAAAPPPPFRTGP